MTEKEKRSYYDLENRTFLYAQNVNEYVLKLPRTLTNKENGKQLCRSAGSVGANYIEANESLSKKDFTMRIKICRKEAKESRFWISLTKPEIAMLSLQERLIQESTELMKIFGAILKKSG